jgi:hypothetical protein
MLFVGVVGGWFVFTLDQDLTEDCTFLPDKLR